MTRVMGFTRHEQVTVMTAHPTLNLKTRTSLDSWSKWHTLSHNIVVLFCSHTEMHFLVVLVCSCLGVVDEMLTKDLHVTFLTFVKWPSPFGGQGRRPPFTRQHFANSCTFQSPPYAHLQSIPPIMGYYFTTRFTFTLQTGRISFSLMRDRRPCWHGVLTILYHFTKNSRRWFSSWF